MRDLSGTILSQVKEHLLYTHIQKGREGRRKGGEEREMKVEEGRE